jgi:hypothetical protein
MKNSGATFAVGLAARIGAGISMGFAEALSDDGLSWPPPGRSARPGDCGTAPRAQETHSYPSAGLSRRWAHARRGGPS